MSLQPAMGGLTPIPLAALQQPYLEQLHFRDTESHLVRDILITVSLICAVLLVVYLSYQQRTFCYRVCRCGGQSQPHRPRHTPANPPPPAAATALLELEVLHTPQNRETHDATAAGEHRMPGSAGLYREPMLDTLLKQAAESEGMPDALFKEFLQRLHGTTRRRSTIAYGSSKPPSKPLRSSLPHPLGGSSPVYAGLEQETPNPPPGVTLGQHE